jgi:hypothetical protein
MTFIATNDSRGKDGKSTDGEWDVEFLMETSRVRAGAVATRVNMPTGSAEVTFGLPTIHELAYFSEAAPL